MTRRKPPTKRELQREDTYQRVFDAALGEFRRVGLGDLCAVATILPDGGRCSRRVLGLDVTASGIRQDATPVRLARVSSAV